MKIKSMIVDTDSLKESLFKLDAVDSLNSFSDSFLELFCCVLFGQIKLDGFKFTPRAEFLPAGNTGDGTFICRTFWDIDLVTAAFLACKLKFHHSLCVSPVISANLPAASFSSMTS